MSQIEKRPTFLEAFFDDAKEQARERGIRGLVPWWAMFFAIIGLAAGFYVPGDVLSGDRLDISTAVYAGFLTVNGLVIAVSWGAFANIYQTVTAPGFVSYLKQKKMLGHYLYFINFVHLFQSIALMISAVTLVTVLFHQLPPWLHRCLFAATIAATAYGFRWAIGTITVMQDVVWYRSIYDEDRAAQGTSSNIVPMPGPRGP